MLNLRNTYMYIWGAVFCNYVPRLFQFAFSLVLIMHLKLSSAGVVCCKYLPNITDELSIEANSVDPEQTAPIGAAWFGSTLFVIQASSAFQQTIKADDFCCDWRIKPIFQHIHVIIISGLTDKGQMKSISVFNWTKCLIYIPLFVGVLCLPLFCYKCITLCPF